MPSPFSISAIDFCKCFLFAPVDIIKELEFLCGYPATSIQERLYFDEGKMQGLMIYTIAGAEGSYGGLSSICKSDKIGKLIRFALFRATDCSSNPICY